MEGQVKILINGKWEDIWTKFGATLVKGAYEKLLAPPPMKEYVSNSSRLNHGKEILAHIPRTDSKEFTLQFIIRGTNEIQYLQRCRSFIETLEKGDVQLKVSRLKTIYKLVYTKCSSYGDYGLKMGKFTVNFTEPNTKDREVVEV